MSPLSGLVFLAETPQHSHPTWADFSATTWIAVVLVGLGTLWTIWKAVMYTLHPGEQEPDHIKRLILGEPEALQVELSSAHGGASPREVHTPPTGSDGPASDDRPAGDDTAEHRHD